MLINVRAVQRTHIANHIGIDYMAHLGVPARNGYVVETDLALWIATDIYECAQREALAGLRSRTNDEHSLADMDAPDCHFDIVKITGRIL